MVQELTIPTRLDALAREGSFGSFAFLHGGFLGGVFLNLFLGDGGARGFFTFFF